MKRKLYDSLMQWKTEENGRTALLMENIARPDARRQRS